MKLIFVSGPISSTNSEGYSDAFGVYMNGSVMMRTALEVWKMGAVALCPYGNTFCFTGSLPYDQLLDGDFLLLSKCDALVHAWDWRESKGAVAEDKWAKEHGIPVFDNTEELRLWLHTLPND